MRLSYVCAASALLVATDAFLTTTRTTTPSFGVASRLFTGAWLNDEPLEKVTELQNPEEHPMAYLREPPAVKVRGEGLTGRALVTGLVKTRADQTTFDMLHDPEESQFGFDKIVAFVDDLKFAKQRLISRSSRYTGLLNKLEFQQADEPGALPTAAQLDEMKPTTWVAVVDSGDLLAQVSQIGRLAQACETIVSVGILVAGASDLDAAASQKAVDDLKAGSTTFTLIAVGDLVDRPEGERAYRYAPFGAEDSAKGEFSREEAIRLTTQCLQLECGANRALAFREISNVNVTESRLIRGMREAGYTRPQEIQHMIVEGPAGYQRAIDAFYKEYPNWKDGVVYGSNWWMDPNFLRMTNETLPEDIQRRLDEEDMEPELVFERNVEDFAKDWLRIEYNDLIDSDFHGGDPILYKEFEKKMWEKALEAGREHHKDLIEDLIKERADKAAEEAAKAAMEAL